MITLTAKINLLSGNNDALYDISCNIIPSENGNSIENILGVERANKPYIGTRMSDAEGYIGIKKIKNHFSITGTVSLSQPDRIITPLGQRYSTTAILNTTFTANDTILEVSSCRIIKSGQIVAQIPAGENDLFVIEFPKEPIPKGSEGIQFNIYAPQEPIENSPGIYSPMDLYGAEIYLEGEKIDITYAQRYEINISATDIIGNLVFSFSEKIFPTELYINNIKYTNDKPIFFIDTGKEKEFSISITKLNKSYSNLIIYGIYSGLSINVDRKNMINCSSNITDRSDLKFPSFGIISNVGEIKFNDTYGLVLQCAENLWLREGAKCKIWLNNTLVDGANKIIGSFETEQWDYDNDNRVVSVSLKDDLEEWQEINVEGISYDPRKNQIKSFHWLYNYLWELTNPSYPMLRDDELDGKTYEILKNSYIQYPLFESGSLWEQWTKLCEVCQLHIYKDNNGIVVCRYNGGN